MKIPLLREHKDKICSLWLIDCNEDIYYRKKRIFEYCIRNNCDYLCALELIIERIAGKYFVDYSKSNDKIVFRYYEYEELLDFLYGSYLCGYRNIFISVEINRGIVDEIVRIINMHGYYNNLDFFVADSQIHEISMDRTNKEIIDLRAQCDIIYKDRIEKGDTYNKYLYVPYEMKIKPLELEPIKKTFRSIYSKNALEAIFLDSIKQKLFSEDTQFSDFLYVFGLSNQPKDFSHLEWTFYAKNKMMNKKLLIQYCIKILGLKINDVDKEFFQWANSCFLCEVPLQHKHKPEANYQNEILDKIFI